jgi:hypothetical protein
MKKPAIPSTQQVSDATVASLLRPMKENLEIITGVRGGELALLAENSTNSQVISKINEIIQRLNQTGN